MQPPAGQPFFTPPDLNKITFSRADSENIVTVTGQPGAIPGSYTVHVQSLETGAQVRTTSAANGAFQATIPAPNGSTIAVSYGNANILDWMQGSPAIQITVNPETPTSPTEIPFSAGAPDGFGTGYWIAEGVLAGWSFQPGQSIDTTITFTYTSPTIDASLDLNALRTRSLPQLTLSRVTDGDGDAVQATFIPVLMTATGLPIFSRGGFEHNALSFQTLVGDAPQVDNSAILTVEFSLQIPLSLPPGHYVGKLRWQPETILQGQAPPPQGELAFAHGTSANSFLPVIRIGAAAPPTIPWMLLANTLSNGTRGAVARESKDAFALGTKVTYSADSFVIPREDPVTGTPIQYRLEPFLPTVGYSMGGPNRSVPPLVSFLFPSGELHVTVTRPDGSVEDLGRSPFRSARAKLPLTGEQVFGPTSLQALYELTTLDPAFLYQFSEYGRYVVTMEGWTQDATGITYSGGGSYDVYVARDLDLDLGTFLNTPLEVGDVLSPVVQVRPAGPAEIEIDFKLYPNSDRANVLTKSITGTTNRFGYFHPGPDAEQLVASAPGEYVVDITASYTDSEGVFWMGSLKGASVVETPGTSLIVHGKRGITAVAGPPGSSPAWYFMRNIDPPGVSGEEDGGGVPQMFYPYHRGDIAWAADETASGIFPMLSLQDPEGITALSRIGQGPGGGIDLGAIGEIDIAFPNIAPYDLPAVQYPELANIWAYYYTSVQRPGVTVRSFVGSGEVSRAYWQFGDAYNGQLGNSGADGQGDLPTDIKLQYGGIVYRDLASGVNEYAIYGSMTVMIAKGTELGQRVFPPFQGGAGGPTGGPILTLDGREIDIFFTPVGVMPGSVLEIGDTFSFSGAMWPTLPSLVELTVTTPSGSQINATGRANKIGYFYSPGDDFVVTEPGVYTVNLRVTHDGATSAGVVEAPFPTGGVLGTPDGTYVFYVVPAADTSVLAVQTPSISGGLSLLGNPPRLTVIVEPTAGLTNTVVHFTANLTGTVLESGTLPQANGSATYIYDLDVLRQRFANLDRNPSDTVVITLAVTGTNASGQPAAYAIQVLIQGSSVFALTIG